MATPAFPLAQPAHPFTTARARRSRSATARLCLCAASWLLSSHVWAVEPSEVDKETARELVFAGDRAFRDGNVAQALARYSTAYRLVRVPSVGIEVARAQAALGQLRSAYRSALETAELPKAAGEKPVLVQARADAAALAKELRERIPTLRIEITPLLPAARIAIDGVAMPGDAARRGLWLDPGKHEVSVSAPGFLAAEVELRLTEREKRSLPVRLEPEKSAAVLGLERARAQLTQGQLRAAYRSALAVGALAQRKDEAPVSVQARASAAALAGELRERIPTLRIVVTPELTEARVAIDGVAMPGDAPRRGLWLDPGKHRVGVSAPGFLTAEIDLELAERERSELAVKLDPEPPRVPGAPQGNSSPGGPANGSSPPSPR